MKIFIVSLLVGYVSSIGYLWWDHYRFWKKMGYYK